MTDVHTKEQRSRNMSAVRGKNTTPELHVRRSLHAAGYRFRLHDKQLPGRPDLTLPKYRTAIFVDGCFWHGHDCPLFKVPSTRTEFWLAKIGQNRARDAINEQSLISAGWRVLRVWECALRGKGKIGPDTLVAKFEEWLASEEESGEIP